MSHPYTDISLSAQHPHDRSDDERRRKDWQQNDRRKIWPWVVDSNDRRSGFDRRLQQRRHVPLDGNWTPTYI